MQPVDVAKNNLKQTVKFLAICDVQLSEILRIVNDAYTRPNIGVTKNGN